MRTMRSGIRFALALVVALTLAAPVGAWAADKAEGKKAKSSSAKIKKGKVEVQEDRIKSVQRKIFLKSGRWELEPVFAISLNDAFYQKMGGGASVLYHPVDNLGIELHGV